MASALLRISRSARFAEVVRRSYATLVPSLGVAPAAHRFKRGRVASMGATSELIAQMGPPPDKKRAHFCSQCGGRIEWAVPSGDHCWRHVCSACGFIDYYNPRMVVGCIVEHEGRILLCRRGIQPCIGQWTVPAGFLELAESTADGAARETREEALAAVEILAPYVHFDIPRIDQAYILFRARLAAPFTFGAGEETQEAALFSPDDIPFDELAFSSISTALHLYVEDLRRGEFSVHHGVIDKVAGSDPNDPDSFQLRDTISLRTGKKVMETSRL